MNIGRREHGRRKIGVKGHEHDDRKARRRRVECGKKENRRRGDVGKYVQRL